MEAVKTYFAHMKRNWLWHAFVFSAYLSAAYFAGYLFRIVGTEPAVLFHPNSLSFAAVILMGYAAIPAIVGAIFVNGILSGANLILLIASAIAQTAQSAAALYALKKLRFSRFFETSRDFFVFFGVILVASLIVPTVNVIARMVYGSVFAPIAQLSWIHLWIGLLSSTIVLTPFIIRWWGSVPKRTVLEWMEMGTVMGVFLINNYAISFLGIQSYLGISLTIPYFVLLLWIAMRGGTAFLSATLVGTFSLTIAGILYGAPPTNMQTLPERIFSGEVVFIFIALFYMIFAALEENRKTILKQLKSYTENLEQTVETKELDAAAKNEFISVLGHEIRNPLASLLSSIELMRITRGADQSRILESMEDRVRSMGRLLDDIFDISRITRNKLIIKKQTLRARDVLRTAADQVSPYMSKNKHRFLVTLPDKNVLINADPVRIEQVITNLLYNAAKYTPAGGLIEFKSNFERQSGSENAGYLIMRVRDTGVGLTEEEQERVFEPFTQINPRQSIMGGIGLGLTLAKNLVELHGGTIEVQSDGAGRGSEFIVRLPSEIGMVMPVQKKEIVYTPVSQESSSKILIVDDNVDAARSLSKLLEFHGHDVELAHTGEEVLKKVQKIRPETIVLDIGLPDIDGYEVAKRLRAQKDQSTLIALSGFGQDEHRRRAREAGFNFYLTKPVSVADVLAIVRKSSKPSLNGSKVRKESE